VAEIFFFLFLAMPLLLIWWLFEARRRARGLMQEHIEAPEPGHSTFAYEEVSTRADGLNYGRTYGGDEASRPPGDHSGVVDGIKAMEGRR
jgi:hypothetical protein